MTDTKPGQQTVPQGNQWLKPYYFSRGTFSVVWVAAAFTVGKSMPAASAALLPCCLSTPLGTLRRIWWTPGATEG